MNVCQEIVTFKLFSVTPNDRKFIPAVAHYPQTNLVSLKLLLRRQGLKLVLEMISRQLTLPLVPISNVSTWQQTVLNVMDKIG